MAIPSDQGVSRHALSRVHLFGWSPWCSPPFASPAVISLFAVLGETESSLFCQRSKIRSRRLPDSLGERLHLIGFCLVNVERPRSGLAVAPADGPRIDPGENVVRLVPDQETVQLDEVWSAFLKSPHAHRGDRNVEDFCYAMLSE